MEPVLDSGASPSGKAAVFGTAIRRFESFRPKTIDLTRNYEIIRFCKKEGWSQ